MKLNPDIYGGDPVGTAEAISKRILGFPEPTLDIHGEHDDRAVSEGNVDTHGPGRADQGEPPTPSEAGEESPHGGTGEES
jgi:hypothetical protein